MQRQYFESGCKVNRTGVIRFFNGLMALVFMGIILAAFYQELAHHELPCPLCYLQRLGMVGVSLGNLMNLRFGVKVHYYAFSLFSILFGGGVALRQISLHVCPDFPTFGYPVFGLSLYTWSFLSFCCALFAVILLLFFHTPEVEEERRLNWWEKSAFFVVFIVILANCFAAGQQCKIGLCKNVSWPQVQQLAQVYRF
ncbi:MAG: disulfide bond formation protein B [Chlamydiota bacterium]